MDLQREDFATTTWHRLTHHCQARLQELRELNDAVVHDQTKTALIRGQISEVKRILALAQASAGSGGEPTSEWPSH